MAVSSFRVAMICLLLVIEPAFLACVTQSMCLARVGIFRQHKELLSRQVGRGAEIRDARREHFRTLQRPECVVRS
jgi:hypothetical protein